MAKKKKKNSSYKIILFVLVIILLVFLYQSFYRPSYQDNLKKLGYKEDEIENIIDKIDDEVNEYDEYLAKYVSYDNFNYAFLDRYKAYAKKYNDLSVDEVVMGVNLDFDTKNIEYSDSALAFTKEKYYKLDNLERYLNYAKKHTDLSNSDVIREVHANLDLKFYEDYVPTDFSKGLLIIANKFNYLGEYVPTDLVNIPSEYGGRGLKASEVAVNAYINMYKDIAKEGMSLVVNSAYRSYATQKSLYNNYVARNGFAWAEKWSARPGFSEHQTGLAMDIVTNSSNFDNFEETKEYTWLVNNSYKYGFILRYPSDDYYLTGYNFESWHFRYVGVDVATKIHDEGLTYDEYYEYYVK